MNENLAWIAHTALLSWSFGGAALVGVVPRARVTSFARIIALSVFLVTCLYALLTPRQDFGAHWGALLCAFAPILLTRAPATQQHYSFIFCLSGLLLLIFYTANPFTRIMFLGVYILTMTFDETLITTRVHLPWHRLRLRLVGVLTALLGTGLGEDGLGLESHALGDLFVSMGLCLVIGAGTLSGPSSQRRVKDERSNLFEILLWLAVLSMMLRLPQRETIQIVLLTVGLAKLWLGVLFRHPAWRLCVAMSTLGAAIPQGHLAALLLATTGFILSVDDEINEATQCAILAALPPWPSFPASCDLLIGLLRFNLLSAALFAGAIAWLLSRANLAIPSASMWRISPGLWALALLGSVAVLLHAAAPLPIGDFR